MMPYIKTTDIFAKIIPLSASEKEHFADLWEQASGDEKGEISTMLWDAFTQFRNDITEIYYQSLITKASQGKLALDSSLYTKAEKMCWEYVTDRLAGKSSDAQTIEQIRNDISTLK
jgi:hypothetical protein